MNRYLALGCLGLGLMVSPLFGRMGQSAVPSNPKVGMMDIEKTLSETPAGKRAIAEFDKRRLEKQAKLDADQTELRKAAADLDKQAAVLKPEVLEAKKLELQKKFSMLQQTYAKLEQELAKDRAKLIEDLLAKAEPFIKQIAKDEGVSVIFEREAMVWWDQSVDLTAKLEAKLQ